MILIILIGALFAALYALFTAPILLVRVTIPQSFFTFLFLLLPWIPIVTLVWAAGFIMPTVPLLPIFILIFLFLIFPIVLVIRFSQGISLVSGCTKGRCLASVAIPFFLIYTLMLWATLQWQSIDRETPTSATTTVERTQ